MKRLDLLKKGKCPGEDKITSDLIEKAGKEFAEMLDMLFSIEVRILRSQVNQKTAVMI